MRDYAELVFDLRRHHCDAKEDDTQEVCEECAYDVIVADKSKFNGITDVCTCGLMHRAADAIEELLAKVPKNGNWIAERDGSIVELSKDGFVGDSCHCSVCNEHLDGSEEYAVKGIFCPSCGAIMNR